MILKKNKIYRNIFSGYIVYIIIGLINLISIPIYVKIIGVENYSLIGFFIVLQSFIGLFDFGLTPSLIRKISFYKTKSINDFRTAEVIFIFFSILSLFFIFIISENYFFEFFNNDNKTNRKLLLLAFCLSLSLKFQENIYKAPFFGYQKIEEYNYFLVIYNILRVSITIFLINTFNQKLLVFFVTFSSLSAIYILLLKIFINKKFFFKKKINFVFNRKIMIETNAFSTFIFLNSLVTVIITQLDKILLANNVSKQDFSYFIISNNLAYYILIAVTPITVTLFPKFSQLFQEKKFSELKKIFINSSEVVGLFIIPGSIILYLSSEIFLKIFFEEAVYKNLIQIFKFLVIGYALNAISLLTYNLHACSGKIKMYTIFNLIYVIVYVPILIIFLPIYGYKLLLLSWFILNFLYVFLISIFFFNNKFNKIRIEWYISTLFKPFVISISIILILDLLLGEIFNALFLKIFSYLISITFITLFSQNLKHMFSSYIYEKKK